MNIMFLMGGHCPDSNRESYPLYLTEVGGKTILERQIDFIREIHPQQLLFCIKDEDVKQFSTDSVIWQLAPSAKIFSLKTQTKGAICSALLGVQYIDNDEELLLMAIDDFIDDSAIDIISEFRGKNADAGVVSFVSVHPRYSFVRVGTSGTPIEFSEKNPISKNALVSFYYFRRGHDFVECAKETIRKGNLINGSFYISQTLNEMILKQKSICMRKIDSEKFHPLKTEALMAEYVYKHMARKNSK